MRITRQEGGGLQRGFWWISQLELIAQRQTQAGTENRDTDTSDTETEAETTRHTPQKTESCETKKTKVGDGLADIYIYIYI